MLKVLRLTVKRKFCDAQSTTHAFEKFHCVARIIACVRDQRTRIVDEDAGATGHWRRSVVTVPGLISRADAIFRLWTESA